MRCGRSRIRFRRLRHRLSSLPRPVVRPSSSSAVRRTRRAASPKSLRDEPGLLGAEGRPVRALRHPAFRKIEAVLSSGLGGGSLIYANVFLRKDENWFVHDSPLPGGGYENWPISRDDLEPHYDAVAGMINPQPSPYPDLPRAAPSRKRLGTRARGVPSPARCDIRPTWRDRRARPAIPEPAYGNIHGFRASPAGCAASATSAATTAPRTPSTTPTCPRPASRRRHPHAARSEGDRAARRRVVKSHTSVHGSRCRRQASPATRVSLCDQADPRGGHVRDHLPALRTASTSRAEPGDRHALLRQRRPARLSVNARESWSGHQGRSPCSTADR